MKATPKQRAALKRGMHIRNMRGAIALLDNVLRDYPDEHLKDAVNQLKDIHDSLFGPMKCYSCGKEVAYKLSNLCVECRKEFGL